MKTINAMDTALLSTHIFTPNTYIQCACVCGLSIARNSHKLQTTLQCYLLNSIGRIWLNFEEENRKLAHWYYVMWTRWAYHKCDSFTGINEFMEIFHLSIDAYYIVAALRLTCWLVKHLITFYIGECLVLARHIQVAFLILSLSRQPLSDSFSSIAVFGSLPNIYTILPNDSISSWTCAHPNQCLLL